MIEWLYDHLHQNRASVAAVAGMTGFAGTVETGVFDAMPRGWMLATVGVVMSTMLSIVIYLAKRDYTRIDETGKETKHEVQVVATNFAIFRTDMTNGMASMQNALTNSISALRSELVGELSNCVKHPHLGQSLSLIHEKVNTIGHNLTIVEVELGLHRRKPMPDEGKPK